MKIICVSGGNYKSFYINCATKQYQCDLLVFNSDIIYDYVVKDELLGDAIVTKELTALSKKMGCVVVAKVNVVLNKIVTKSLIVCDGEKLSVGPSKLGQKICVKEKNSYFISFKNFLLLVITPL